MDTGVRSPRRRVAGWILGAAAAAVGALITGEYELAGFTPYVSGILLGIIVSEVELSVGGDAAGWASGAVGLLAAGSLVWAGWISSGRGVTSIAGGVWPGAVLAAIVGAGWTRWSGGRARVRPSESPEPE